MKENGKWKKKENEIKNKKVLRGETRATLRNGEGKGAARDHFFLHPHKM